MARLVTTGFEVQHLTANVVIAEGQGMETWGGQTAPGLLETSVVRSGAAALGYDWDAGAAGGAFWRFTWAAGRRYFARAYFRKSGDFTNTWTVPVLWFTTGGAGAPGTPIYSIALDNLGRPSLMRGGSYTDASISGTRVGALGAPLANDTWYRLELSMKTDGSAEALIDGVTLASETAVGTQTTPTRFQIGKGSAEAGYGSSARFFFEDVALNDDTVPTGFIAGQPGAQDTWPGAGHIYLLKPTADNARHADWTRGDGNTTALYDALNNTPPTGSATANANRIQNTTAGGASEDYDATLQTPTAAGMPAGEGVRLAQTIANIADNSGSAVTGMAALRAVSGPDEAAESIFDTPTASVGTFPTGWETKRGPVLYAPSVGTPVVRIGKRGVSTTALYADLLGLYVETGDPLAGAGLSMLVG